MSRWRWVAPALGVALFLGAVWVLHRELSGVDYREVRQTLRTLPPAALLWSLLFTAANYAILTGFDLLAFRYVGRAASDWKVVVASFTGYAISNTVGFALISGTSVRYRFYSRWGLTASELSRIVVFYSGTFWLGLLVLGGAGLAFDPHPGLQGLAGGALTRGAGVALLAMAAAYALAAGLRLPPLRVAKVEVPFPSPAMALAQFALSTVDWALAGAVFYVLLPPTQLTFAEFLGAFMAAQVLGLVSHVPGGVGVFEGTMAVLLSPYLTAEQILASLVIYRLVYYLAPLAAALAVLVADEVRIRRHHLARWGSAFGALTQQMAPKVLAAFVFVAGAVLLVSGATPGAGPRLRWLTGFLPLGVVEASWFIGSVTGVGLLIASHGVARRLDFAFTVTAALLGLGMATALLKGADYEEAVFLALLLAALVASRDAFDRRAAFWAASFSPGWVVAVVSVVVASLWLAYFAFRHVEYSSQLWWRFAVAQDAPRVLRASVGAMVAVLAFGVARLLRPAPPRVASPTGEELRMAGEIVAGQESTVPYLVYLRDKAVLLNERATAFVMYAVQGRTWVVMGDPVGPPEAAPALIRRFIEQCDDFGGVPVFYQVAKERLHQYADFGLTFVKLGEEAYVPLEAFGLGGAERKPFRLVLNRFDRSGMRFRVAPPAEVPALLAEVRSASDDWLRHRGVAEKGFSLGFFDEAYVRRFPLAVVEEGGRVQAFATVWPGPGGVELSVDLMRYRGDAANSVMEALLLHLMLWGRDHGYRRFNLGMAPLSGLEMSAIAPAWTRVGTWLFERGGRGLYSFAGLRQFKEKFHPRWEPRYMAYPGGLNLPRITAEVYGLVAGGYRRIYPRRPGEG